MIYVTMHVSTASFPLSLHLPNLPKMFQPQVSKRPFKGLLGRWVLPAHDFKVLLDEATNLLDTKVATGNPRETPVTRADLFEGFFYLTTRIP